MATAMAPMATESAADEVHLVRAARGGDSRAAGELIERHAPGVLTLLTRMLSDRHLAQDMAQETFLRAYRSLDRFDVDRGFGVWVRAIAWNLAIDQIRRQKRRGERLGFGGLDDDRTDDSGTTLDLPDHREEPPEARIERFEERALVRRVLDLLPAPSRAVLVLRDLEGLSYEDVAQVLDCPLGTAKSRINRARLEFRNMYLRLTRAIEGRS